MVGLIHLLLQASLQAERQAAENLRKAFSEAEARNSELATELENATRKADQLHESVQRFVKYIDVQSTEKGHIEFVMLL